jgi:hypothetical protein
MIRIRTKPGHIPDRMTWPLELVRSRDHLLELGGDLILARGSR